MEITRKLDYRDIIDFTDEQMIYAWLVDTNNFKLIFTIQTIKNKFNSNEEWLNYIIKILTDNNASP